MKLSVLSVLQTIVACGLLNVWLVRPRMKTSFRGGDASNIFEEFKAYGLPEWSCYLVGTLKVGCALLLLVGLWDSSLALPAAALILALMVGAVGMHIKVKDPLFKSLPAITMLVLSGAICVLTLSSSF